SRRRHTRLVSDWSSDVCSSDLEIFELEMAAADDEVVGDHDTGDGAEKTGVAEEPAGDVGTVSREELPRHQEDADDAGDEAAGAEGDEARVEVREIVGGRDDVSGDVGVEGC